jgi:hypothetical protein
VHALVLVAVWSRHMFIWLTFTQKTCVHFERSDKLFKRTATARW